MVVARCNTDCYGRIAMGRHEHHKQHEHQHGHKDGHGHGHGHDHKHGHGHGNDHKHGHGHGNDHKHGHEDGHKHEQAHGHVPTTKKRLFATLAVTFLIMVAEVVGGLWSGSLALLADAGHMLTDVLALAIASVALVLSSLPADDRRTYGYRRLEIFAALINGVALVVVSISIFIEATERWVTPREVDTVVMGVVATIGLAANLVGLWLLGGHRGNLNVRGAFLHILGDTLSSVGVLVTAGLIALTGWTKLDAIVSMGIALVIVVTSVSLLREVVEVLLEAAPRCIDTDVVRSAICSLDNVDGVFDLHVWSITSGMPALSAHVVISNPEVDRDVVLIGIATMLREDFSISHSTLQLESHAHESCYCAEASNAQRQRR